MISTGFWLRIVTEGEANVTLSFASSVANVLLGMQIFDFELQTSLLDFAIGILMEIRGNISNVFFDTEKYESALCQRPTKILLEFVSV